MIDRRGLLRVLGTRGLADWVLVEHAREVGCVDERTRLSRSERRTLWRVTVHHDSPSGRGSAHVSIDGLDGNAEAAIDQAVALARSSIGPAWLTPPLAAPAHVQLEDAAVASRAPVNVAVDVLRKLARPVDVVAAASFARENVHVVARQGLRTEWTATRYDVDLLATAGERSVVVRRAARTQSGLELEAALTIAADDLKLHAAAGTPTAGPCALVLAAEAMLHDGDLGVWSPFVAQADAVIERQGLTRYRERTPIAAGADQVSEPLSITSDGALDHGLLSAPIGEQGDAVRRFPLVERGIAAGLGLSPREAALRGRDPNGGVRNLVVARGTWSGTSDAKRVVEVRRLRSLAIDSYTGEASLEIALGLDRGKPFTGGSVRIDLIAALARARRSATTIVRGAYKGPHMVLIDRVELIA